MNPLFVPSCLIFIDYDGVLQTSALPDFIDFEFLPRFEAVLRDFPSAGVVIGSTHRCGFDLATLRRIYSADIQPRVIGANPDLPEGRAQNGRYSESLVFLAEAGLVSTPWIAVDDEVHLYPRDCPNLLPTNKYCGFTEDVEAELRTWLLKVA